MIRSTRRLVMIALALIGGMSCLFVSENNPPSLITKAHAIIGRPLTPLSYAGVARRTTRRAIYGGAAVYGAPVAVAPVCRQVVDAYGRIVTVC